MNGWYVHVPALTFPKRVFDPLLDELFSLSSSSFSSCPGSSSSSSSSSFELLLLLVFSVVFHVLNVAEFCIILQIFSEIKWNCPTVLYIFIIPPPLFLNLFCVCIAVQRLQPVLIYFLKVFFSLFVCQGVNKSNARCSKVVCRHAISSSLLPPPHHAKIVVLLLCYLFSFAHPFVRPRPLQHCRLNITLPVQWHGLMWPLLV